jgi:hypothetical protein
LFLYWLQDECLVVIVFWERAGKPLSHCLHAGIGDRQQHARVELGNRTVVIGAAVSVFRHRRYRRPDLRLLWKIKCPRHDTDDLVAITVDTQRLAKGGRSRAEVALRKTQSHHCGATGVVTHKCPSG